jgi:hypothetical protein
VLFEKRGQRNVTEAERLGILLSIIIDAHLDIDSAIAATTETQVRVALSYSAPLQRFAHAFPCLALPYLTLPCLVLSCLFSATASKGTLFRVYVSSGEKFRHFFLIDLMRDSEIAVWMEDRLTWHLDHSSGQERAPSDEALSHPIVQVQGMSL